MAHHRDRKGFRRAGEVRPDQLGIPSRTAKELHLAWAWRHVAGEALARRAQALRIRRGVLEIHVPEDRWVATLVDLLPRLAGRLASHHPELGLRKFKLVREGEPARGCAVLEPVPDDPGWEPPQEPAGSGTSPEPTPGADGSLAERLHHLASTYLDRTLEPDPKP